jgi:hypothetical protein
VLEAYNEESTLDMMEKMLGILQAIPEEFFNANAGRREESSGLCEDIVTAILTALDGASSRWLLTIDRHEQGVDGGRQSGGRGPNCRPSWGAIAHTINSQA